MSTTKRICLYGIGIALFVVLSLCLQVPVFENYYLCLGYVVMAVYCWYFGPVAGTLVGTLGVILYCVLINGLRGMPGWALGNAVIGMIMGAAVAATRNWQKSWLRWGCILAAILFSTAAGILLCKSAVEHILYAQPMVIRIAKNIYAFVADVVVLTLGFSLCPLLKSAVSRYFPPGDADGGRCVYGFQCCLRRDPFHNQDSFAADLNSEQCSRHQQCRDRRPYRNERNSGAFIPPR